MQQCGIKLFGRQSTVIFSHREKIKILPRCKSINIYF